MVCIPRIVTQLSVANFVILDVPFTDSIKDKDNPYHIAYHPTLPFLAICTCDGRVSCWNTNTKEHLGNVKVVGKEKESIEQVYFHPTLPFFIAFNGEGYMYVWNFFPMKKKWLVKVVNQAGDHKIEPCNIEYEVLNSLTPDSLSINWKISLNQTRFHPTYNYISFLFNFKTGLESSQYYAPDTLIHNIYSLSLHEARVNDALIPNQQDFLFWLIPQKDKSRNRYVYSFPNECCQYIDANEIHVFSPGYNETSLAKVLPLEDFDSQLLKPVRIMRNKDTDRLLVFFVRQSPENDSSNYAIAIIGREQKTKDITVSPAAGTTGAFIGSEEFLVLSANGKYVEIWKNEEVTTIPNTFELTAPMTNVFWTPLDFLLFFDPQYWRLVASGNPCTSGSKFVLNYAKFVQLYEGESINQIQWFTSVSETIEPFAGVVTNRRIFIMNSKLSIISQQVDIASSCHWIGPTLLYTTESHVKYMTIKGYSNYIASLKLPGASLVSVLCDRIVVAVRKSGQTTILNSAVSLLEPLINGILHYTDIYSIFKSEDLIRILKTIVTIYDKRRVSLDLIYELKYRNHTSLIKILYESNDKLKSECPELADYLARNTTEKNPRKTSKKQYTMEMRTLPLEMGSGNVIIGPLLTNRIIRDWFPRQIQYFEIPYLLNKGSIEQPPSRNRQQSTSSIDIKERRVRRTFTVGGGDGIPVDTSLFSPTKTRGQSRRK